MSAGEVKMARRLSDPSTDSTPTPQTNNNHKKHHHHHPHRQQNASRNQHKMRPGDKRRRHSAFGGGDVGGAAAAAGGQKKHGGGAKRRHNSGYHPQGKRRRNESPTVEKKAPRFLLGGNKSDPLNLRSLENEEVNRRMNQVTPESSPLPVPAHRTECIEILIPPNIRDPLNLEADLLSPTRSRKRKKQKRKSGGAGVGVVQAAAAAEDSASGAPQLVAAAAAKSTSEEGSADRLSAPSSTGEPQEKVEPQKRRKDQGKGGKKEDPAQKSSIASRFFDQ